MGIQAPFHSTQKRFDSGFGEWWISADGTTYKVVADKNGYHFYAGEHEPSPGAQQRMADFVYLVEKAKDKDTPTPYNVGTDSAAEIAGQYGYWYAISKGGKDVSPLGPVQIGRVGLIKVGQDGTPSVSIPNPLNWAEGLAKLVDTLLDPAFWVRAGEIVLGLIIAGIGVAHLSESAGNTLRSIPLYGKAIPR